MDIKKAANLFINFTLKRLAEIFGIGVFVSGILFLSALLTYSLKIKLHFSRQHRDKIFWFSRKLYLRLILSIYRLISYMFSITLIMAGINIFRVKEFFINRKYFFCNILLFIWVLISFTYSL